MSEVSEHLQITVKHMEVLTFIAENPCSTHPVPGIMNISQHMIAAYYIAAQQSHSAAKSLLMMGGIQIQKYIEYTHSKYTTCIIPHKVKQNNYEHERIVKRTKKTSSTWNQ